MRAVCSRSHHFTQLNPGERALQTELCLLLRLPEKTFITFLPSSHHPPNIIHARSLLTDGSARICQHRLIRVHLKLETS